MNISLTVIGLDRIGLSVGLALSKKGAELQRTGVDLDHNKEEAAKNYQVFNLVTGKLDDAVKLADLIVIDLPLDEVKDMFTRFAQWIKKDAVLLYFSGLPEKVFGWAKQLLPENVYFIALTPTINPKYIEDLDQLTPHADLFDNSQIFISHLPNIPPKVIQIATDLTSLIGAIPCFADLTEVDGLQTVVQYLPRITAAALMDEVINEPGWRDASKLAGDDLAIATRLLNSILVENQGQLMIENEQNSLRVIANLQNSLAKLAQFIQAGDSQKLQEYLESLQMERESWLGKRRNTQPREKKQIFGRK